MPQKRRKVITRRGKRVSGRQRFGPGPVQPGSRRRRNVVIQPEPRLPLPTQLIELVDMPETVVRDLEDLFESTAHYADVEQHALAFLLLSINQADTDGLLVAVGVYDQHHAFDSVGPAIGGRIIYHVGTPEVYATYGNTMVLRGSVTSALERLKRRRPNAKVAFLYLENYTTKALEQLADRLVAGTIIVVTGPECLDFFAWTVKNGREMYALSHIGCELALVMLAN